MPIGDDLFYVFNIPSDYHASDLRNFFSQYVESQKFSCFHFRHRPSLVFPSSELAATLVSTTEIISAIKSRRRDENTRCALVSIPLNEAADFITNYVGLHWPDPQTDLPMNGCCSIKRVRSDPETYEGKVHTCSHKADLKSLIEFNPPKWMPQGNVGTPSSHFFHLIKTCQLESSVISKLKLNFRKCRNGRKYGAVPYIYDVFLNPPENSSSHDAPRTGKGTILINDDEFMEFSDIHGFGRKDISDPYVSVKETIYHPDTDTEDIKEQEEEDVEEWDRFEALHDDPYHMNRGDKANLKYENKVELVWEKGGSGLVFHTDERTWRKMDVIKREEFFDEPASFDWDIDMEPYDDPTRVGPGPTASGNWGAERDTANLIDINRSKEDIDVPNLYHDPKALFSHEVNTKGYGSVILKRMGWKPGMRLGASGLQSTSGLLEPLTVEGKSLAKNRPGLGYHGPLRPKVPITTQNERLVYIRTIFDSPQTVLSRGLLDSPSSLLRRRDSDLSMKWLPKPSEKPPELCSHDTPYAPRNRTIIISPYTKLSKEGIAFVSGGMLNPNSYLL